MMTLRDRPIPRWRVAGLGVAALLLIVAACEAPRPVGPAEETGAASPASTASAEAAIETLHELAAELGTRVEWRLDREPVERLPDDFDPSEMTRWSIDVVPATDGGPARFIAHFETGEGSQSTERVDPPPTSGADDESPTSIELITGEEIEAAGVTRIEQVLRGRIQGLTVSGSDAAQGAGGKLNIRGLTSINGRNSPLIYIDEVRVGLASGSDRPGAATVLQSISPQDIERIEVIKGSAAEDLFGADARGGVIQIFTKAFVASGGGGG